MPKRHSLRLCVRQAPGTPHGRKGSDGHLAVRARGAWLDFSCILFNMTWELQWPTSRQLRITWFIISQNDLWDIRPCS